jgi:hypothetical protein
VKYIDLRVIVFVTPIFPDVATMYSKPLLIAYPHCIECRYYPMFPLEYQGLAREELRIETNTWIIQDHMAKVKCDFDSSCLRSRVAVSE